VRAVSVEVADDVPDDRGDELWEKLWQQQIVRRAMEMVREQYMRKGKLLTFQAFEHKRGQRRQCYGYSQVSGDERRECSYGQVARHREASGRARDARR
jgi:hypothetical protein